MAFNRSKAAGSYTHPNHTGDVTSVADGATTIANDAVTYAKVQNVTATDKILGRSSSGAGVVEEIDCTSAGRALIDDADAAAQRTTLGLAIGTNVQAYDADNAVKDVAQNFTAGQSGAVVAVGISGTDAVADMSAANNFTLTMHASTGYLLSFSNWTVGQSGIITIDHAGGALSFSTAIRFEGGTPTVGTTGTDFLAYYCENAGSGTEYVLATYFLAPSNP